eukprot:13741274-Alexandrium_andersonii.AAC.1
MWSCDRFGRERGRPGDALAERVGWPAKPAGHIWSQRELIQAKEVVAQMVRILRNIQACRYPATAAEDRARRAAQGMAAREYADNAEVRLVRGGACSARQGTREKVATCPVSTLRPG